jgi:hypothetical protein
VSPVHVPWSLELFNETGIQAFLAFLYAPIVRNSKIDKGNSKIDKGNQIT